jgi:Spy/CpxP family protein refolding chaperone
LRLTPLRTLLASAVVVAGLAAVAVQAAPSTQGECGHRAAAAHHRDSGPDGMAPRMQGRMLERIGASAEQREQIRKIMTSARGDMKARRDEGKALRDKAAALFAQPTIDAAAVESLRQEMVQRHDQASQRMTQAMLEAAQVLTPEQRTKLAEAMKERRARKGGHRHGGDKGHGAEGGPGHGHHGKEGERKAS